MLRGYWPLSELGFVPIVRPETEQAGMTEGEPSTPEEPGSVGSA